jgi:transposase
MIQDGKPRGFAMGQAIPVQTDYTAGEVRRFAQRAKDAAQARRLLAIAAVLDSASREEAATIGGMDRQTLRDWVIRFNEQEPDGLINIPSPGVPLNSRHKAFLARMLDEGPIPAIHGVLVPLPPRAPELDGRENIWQFMRQNWLSNRFSNPSTTSTTAATLGTHSSTNPGRLCPSRDATGQQWSLNLRIGISRFLLSLPELSSQDLNRPFRSLTPGRFPFVNSTPARVSTVSITTRLSGSPAYRPTSILLIVFR